MAEQRRHPPRDRQPAIGQLLPVSPVEREPLDDNVGDLPEELAEPPDPVPEPKGSVYPQPTAISLNEQ
jgi:hypothetical protein